MSEEPQQRRRPSAGTGRQLSRLVLTGFMGAGKSTIGALVAENLGWQFLDLDRLVEAACGRTVDEIFRDRGEPYFRAMERESLERMEEQLGEDGRVVLALGGGAVEDPLTRSLLANSAETCLVFLDAPLPELLTRLRGTAPSRPLLRRPEELASRYERRLPHYRTAHIIVSTSGLTPREVAVHVIERAAKEWLIEPRPERPHEQRG